MTPHGKVRPLYKYIYIFHRISVARATVSNVKISCKLIDHEVYLRENCVVSFDCGLLFILEH